MKDVIDREQLLSKLKGSENITKDEFIGLVNNMPNALETESKLISSRFDYCQSMIDKNTEVGFDDNARDWRNRAEGVRDVMDILEMWKD